MQSTTFVHGADFIRKLNQYTESERRLSPGTLFVTIRILNVNTIDTHEAMLMVLEGFLQERLAISAIENISIKKIVDLTALFLKYNRFYYEGRLYRFKKGAPSGVPLSETLSTIYIFQWQKLLLNEPCIRGELYGR